MATKVKGESIKEGSIPLSALAIEVKDKIENAGGGADWNAQEGEAGYIENRTHSATFTRIEYNQENNKGMYEVAGVEDKLLLLWRKKYFTVHKNIPLTIDVNDGEDTFIVNYNGTTLYITDNNGYLYDEHEYISVSETNIPLAEAFIPETVIKTTPQTLSDDDKSQALANLGIDPVVWEYMCKPLVITSLDDTLPVNILETDDSGLTYIKSQYAGLIRGGYDLNKQKYVEACAVLCDDNNVYDRVYIGDINDCAYINSDGTFSYA